MRAGRGKDGEKNFETLELNHALNRRCAETIIANKDYPQIACSTVNGFAIQFAAIKHAITSYTKVSYTDSIEENFALSSCLLLLAGENVPSKFDTVVPIRQFKENCGRYNLTIGDLIAKGQHIKILSPRIKVGDIICRYGDFLSNNTIKTLGRLRVLSVSVLKNA